AGALGQPLAFPEVAINNVIGVIDQRRRERLDAVAFGGRRGLGHASLPFVYSKPRVEAQSCPAVTARNDGSLSVREEGVDRRKSPGRQARRPGVASERYLHARVERTRIGRVEGLRTA